MTRKPAPANAACCAGHDSRLPANGCMSMRGAPAPPVSQYGSDELPTSISPVVIAGETSERSVVVHAVSVASAAATRKRRVLDLIPTNLRLVILDIRVLPS